MSPHQPEPVDISRRRFGQFADLLQRVLDYINTSESRIDFLEKVSRFLIETIRCDLVEMRVREKDRYHLCRTVRKPAIDFSCRTLPYGDGQAPADESRSALEQLCRYIADAQTPKALPYFSERGSFWTNNLAAARLRLPGAQNRADELRLGQELDFGSLAILPLRSSAREIGLLLFASHHRGYFIDDSFYQLEMVADVLASALAHQRTIAALRERVKELSCLIDISKVISQTDLSEDEILSQAVDLIAPAFRYPSIASSRIVLDGREIRSTGFRAGDDRLTVPLAIGDVERGCIEVVYAEARPERDVGPFLDEERLLLEGVSRQLALAIEEKQAAQDKATLQSQLLHADRLATIGQFAAGVAHELNEPLAGILGFAQLLSKQETLTDRGRRDAQKIEAAALHAREVVKKLLFFGRQLPPQRKRLQINDLIREVLPVLEGRLIKAEVKTSLSLADDLPALIGDPGQLTQVLVNLMVNAMQAMPDGGTMTMNTVAEGGEIVLTVADTGVGMDEETKNKAFLPFFTTKDVNRGTGLGLAVVHGIVTAHRGTVAIDSEPGQGARFIVRLPLDPDAEPGEA